MAIDESTTRMDMPYFSGAKDELLRAANWVSYVGKSDLPARVAHDIDAVKCRSRQRRRCWSLHVSRPKMRICTESIVVSYSHEKG